MIKTILKRYRNSILLFLLMLILLLINKELGMKAFMSTGSSIRQMLLLLPPVFLLLGLMDVWIPKETMMRYMGENSGIKGTILALAIGSFTSGPLYGAFPVAAVLMKKGVKFSNILVFLGAWSTTKIPMLLFEGSNLGWKFTILRLMIDLPGIIIMSNLIAFLTSSSEKKAIYQKAESME